VADHLGDGSLGEVRVEPGEEIQIRSLNAISGDVAFLGIPNQRAIDRALYGSAGEVHGFVVSMGTAWMTCAQPTVVPRPPRQLWPTSRLSV